MTYHITAMPNTRKHSGVSGIPTQLLVNHTLECPLQGGFAQSLTNWANTTAVEASWHWASDPIAIVSMVDPGCAAWHASEANPMSEGFEQAGYARFTRAEWLTPEGRSSIDNHAWIMAQRMKANGIPHRWLTTAEVEQVTKYGNRSIKGLCNHRQIDPETRTDPGNNYPFDVLDERIAFHLGGAAPASPDTTEQEEDTDMAWILAKAPGHPDIHIGNGVIRRRVGTMDTVQNLKHLASRYGVKDPNVQEVPDLWALGHPIDLALDLAVKEIIAAMKPQDVVAQIPDDIAEQVIDALTARLAAKK